MIRPIASSLDTFEAVWSPMQAKPARKHNSVGLWIVLSLVYFLPVAGATWALASGALTGSGPTPCAASYASETDGLVAGGVGPCAAQGR